MTLADFTRPGLLVPTLRGPGAAGVMLHAAHDAAEIHTFFQQIPPPRRHRSATTYGE